MRKKIIPLALVCAFSIPLLAGCSPTTEHKTFYDAWTEFKADSAYSEFFNGDITFSNAIDSAKTNPSSNFYSINYCEKLISISLENISAFYGAFDITPDYNQNHIRKLCNAAISNINVFKAQVEDFNIEKAHFVDIVDRYGISSSQATAELDDFLLDIGVLTIKANTLQVSFTNAFQTLYALPIERESAGTALQTKASVATVQSMLTSDYINYAITKQDGRHSKTAPTLFDAILNLEQKIKTGGENGTSYSSWADAYKLFKAEHDIFNSSLNHVNLKTDPSTLSGTALLHYTRVQNYVSDNANLFVNKTISMLY